jgi:putative hydrolase of the HAD superfamily
MTTPAACPVDRPVLLLDAGGVLLLPSAALVARELAEWSPGPSGASDAALHYNAVAAYDRTGDILDYRRTYAQGLGVSAAHIEKAIAVHAAWHNPWRAATPTTRETLRRLIDETGVDVVIVSDSDGSIASQLEDSGICQAGPGPLPAVLAVCDSAVVGAAKPSRLIFEAACRAAGRRRRLLGHVGDSLRADVHGALAAGLTPFHADPLGHCTAQDHRHVTSLNDIEGVVLR